MAHLEPSTVYDPIADHYEESRGGHRRADALARLVDAWLIPGSLVLDVGAGTGIVAAAMESLGHRAIALDLSAAMLRHAVPRLPGRVVRADGQLLPMPSRSVDAVTFGWSLHHIGSAEAALAEAARVGRPRMRVVAVSARNEAPLDEIQEVMRPLELQNERFHEHVSLVTAAAAAAGLHAIGESWFEQAIEHSPAQAIAGIEARHMSTVWHLDAAAFAQLAQPVIDALRALPDQQRSRPTVLRHRVMAFGREPLPPTG